MSVAEISALAGESPTSIKAVRAWHAYRQGPSVDVTEDDFLKAHLPLVQRVVERIKATLPPHIEAEELFSVGVVGLVHAARGFRPDQGSAFSTYATMRIRGAILDELRRMDWMPRRARAKAKELKEVITNLEQHLSREATEAEVAEAMKLTPEQYADLLDEVRPIACVELDGETSEDGDGTTLHDVVADDSQQTADTLLEHKELLALMAARLDRLPDMQKKVLAFYYFEEMRLGEIAAIFGVTESRICQVHTQAIASLRTYLKSAMES